MHTYEFLDYDRVSPVFFSSLEQMIKSVDFLPEELDAITNLNVGEAFVNQAFTIKRQPGASSGRVQHRSRTLLKRVDMINRVTGFIVSGTDYFAAHLDNGGVRVGMVSGDAFDIPADHEWYHRIMKVSDEDEVETIFDLCCDMYIFLSRRKL